MKIMTCLIEFPEGKLVQAIRKPAEIFIESSFKTLISKAEITMARNVSFFDKHNPRNVFPHGTPVVIYFGYDGVLVEEFRGYVTSISADFPLVIKCQDEMWKLKRIPVNYAATNVSLETLLKSICKGYSIDALEGVNLGSVRFSQTNVGAVLEKISSDFNLYSYMNGKTLVCGKYYSDNSADPVEVLNLDTNNAENSLEYRNSEDIILKIKGKIIGLKGKKIEYEIGDIGGDELNLSYFAVTSKEALKKLVDIDYAKRKRGGYEGSVTAFGTPVFKHGRKVNLASVIYRDRAGRYYIDSVTKKYDPSGIRQSLTLGGKA
jgi:hypothetical protein